MPVNGKTNEVSGFLAARRVLIIADMAHRLLMRHLDCFLDFQFSDAVVAPERLSFRHEALKVRTIQRQTTCLVFDRVIVPCDTQPREAIDYISFVLRLRTFQISIFDAQDESSSVVTCEKVVKQGRTNGPDVKLSRGTWSNADIHVHRLSVAKIGAAGNRVLLLFSAIRQQYPYGQTAPQPQLHHAQRDALPR